MKITSSIICLTALLISCGRAGQHSPSVTSATMHDSASGYRVADSIIYDVTIVNQNPDDAWKEECLKGLDQQAMINLIFDMIYGKKVTACNFETREKLTPAEVRKIEKEPGFNRLNIQMIQFTENWFLDPDNATMTKKVNSMILGYNNAYTTDGTLIGPRALFIVEMN